ncbi:hypothetical protein MCA0614 [Methylococcus capsulatus str. Bath]|uniref:Uncharacterized protein n=1 Tax=Methylococcus capsulatus (strain ATCC 33009 / NCIMB 11132 / Bath) TaxID=243233 RepID=Q60B67_METCA|nr:hypothetical protein MCA0614 [Methylococcus capsulatus str. Bath]
MQAEEPVLGDDEQEVRLGHGNALSEYSMKMPGTAGRTPRMKAGPRFYTAKPPLWDASPNVPLSPV